MTRTMSSLKLDGTHFSFLFSCAHQDVPNNDTTSGWPRSNKLKTEGIYIVTAMCHRESGFVCYSSMTEPVLTNTLAWLAPQSFLLPAPSPDLPWSADCHLFCLSKDCHVSALRTSCVLTLVHAPILRTTLAHSSFLLWDCLPSS